MVRLHYLYLDPKFTEDDVWESLRMRGEIDLISKVGSEFLKKVTRPILKRMRAVVNVACANVL